MFKIIIRDMLYNLQQNGILTSPQSGLIPVGASVNQLAFLCTVCFQDVDTCDIGNEIQSFSVAQVKFSIVLDICCFYVKLTGTLLLWFTHYFSTYSPLTDLRYKMVLFNVKTFVAFI